MPLIARPTTISKQRSDISHHHVALCSSSRIEQAFIRVDDPVPSRLMKQPAFRSRHRWQLVWGQLADTILKSCISLIILEAGARMSAFLGLLAVCMRTLRVARGA